MAGLGKKETFQSLKKSLKIRFWTPGSKPVSLSQGPSPGTPGPTSLGSTGSDRSAENGGGRLNNDVTITLPHSNTQSIIKKMIVVQKYEPKPGEKGLAVNRGESVLLVRDDGDWMYVRNENGTEGYVPRSHLLSPSRTRTRTSSRNGTSLRHVASNGCVQTHSTAPQVENLAPSALSQDEGHHNHVVTNGHYHHPHPSHPHQVAPNEILYDRKLYSPSPSSGVTSLGDQFSPGPPHSLTQIRRRGEGGGGGGGGGREREQAQSSSSSLEDHSHESYSSYEQDSAPPHPRQHPPGLISPLNHMEGGSQDPYQRDPAENSIPRSNSTSSHSTGDSVSVRQPPQLLNGIHYVDKTTNHIYSTLEQPSSPPPPPLPPRNQTGSFSASQGPEHNMYSQLEHTGGVGMRTCSQEALVHPSHHHNSFSEGWTRDRKFPGHPARSASAKSRMYKEVVDIRQNSSNNPRVRQRAIVPPPPLRVVPSPTTHIADRRTHHLHQQQQHQQQPRHRQQNWTNSSETRITKFRKTVWGVFVVTHDFDPMDENEIAIRTGEHVSVWNQDDRDWFWVVKHASSGQEEGFVPSGCLREVSADSKTSIKSASSTTTPGGENSSRLDDLSLPNRHRTNSQDSRHSNSTQQPRLSRPSSGGTNRSSNGSGGGGGSGSQRERRSSESGVQIHRVHHHHPTPAPLSLTDDPLPPVPPSSPPPPYTEFDTNSRRFVSLSQQQQPAVAAEMHHHSQPVGGGYGPPGMHRTRSQGYVTSRNRAIHYPHPSPTSPSSPHPVVGGGGTLV